MTTTKCPCCGGGIETALPVVDQHMIAWGDKAVTVQARQAELMQALVGCKDNIATADYLLTRVWGVADESIDPNRVLRQQINRLRRTLERIGWTIISRRVGKYWLTKLPDDPAV